MYVACPNCRGWMVGDGIPVGATVLCPHCQRQFVMTQAILEAAVHPEASASASAEQGIAGGLSGSGPAAGLAGGQMGGVSQPTAQGPAPSLAPTSESRPTPPGGPGLAGTSGTPLTGSPGWIGAGSSPMASDGPPAQMAPMGRPAMAGGMPQVGGVGPMPGMPVSMPAPPVATAVYPQAAAPAARESVPVRPRPLLLSAEALLIMGFSLMIVAVIVAVMLGYGGRPAAENIGKPSEKAALVPAKGPLMQVQYDLRRRILYIENKDRSWQEAELRINPDPADDEGGYRFQLGQLPQGRKKPVLLNQCLSPSGAPFQGDIQRIVVIAKTADGTLRYVSDLGSSSKSSAK